MSRNKPTGTLSTLVRSFIASGRLSTPASKSVPNAQRTSLDLLAKKESYIASWSLQRWQV